MIWKRMVSIEGIEGDQRMTYGGHRAGPGGQVRQISRGGGQDTLWGEHGQRYRMAVQGLRIVKASCVCRVFTVIRCHRHFMYPLSHFSSPGMEEGKYYHFLNRQLGEPREMK